MSRRAFQVGRAGRGFTLVEVLVALVVIALLIGILLVALSGGQRAARRTADRAAVSSLKQSATQFRDQFRFLPPLVRDNFAAVTGVPLPAGTPAPGGPLGGTISAGLEPCSLRPVLLEPSSGQSSVDRRAMLQFLVHRDAGNQVRAALPDARYSVYSLAFYLVGALPEAVDGVDGPGMRVPRRDGSFERSGRTVDPLFDVSKNERAIQVFADPARPAAGVAEGRQAILDPYNTPYRYYRWLRGSIGAGGDIDERVQAVADLNVPYVLLDPGLSPTGVLDPADVELQRYAPPEAKDATAAIVGAGPDGLFGDEADVARMAERLGISGSTDPLKIRARAMADNAVEFLR